MGSGKTPFLYRNWGIYAGSYNHNIYSSFPSYSSGASDGGKDVAYADAFILPFYPSFTFENVTAQCYNKSQDRHRKLCFFLLLFPYLSMASVFFCPVNQMARFPDLLLYFCVLRSARIGYNTA